jgi:hypothetical protein
VNASLELRFEGTPCNPHVYSASARRTDVCTRGLAGNAVSLYGTTFEDHGNYSVSIDDGPEDVFSGTTSPGIRHNGTLLVRPRSLLPSTLTVGGLADRLPQYYASALPDGKHTLTLTNLAGGSDGWFDVDKAVVSRWGPRASSGRSHHTSAGTVAGIVLGGLAALLLAAFALRLLRRRRAGAPMMSALPAPLAGVAARRRFGHTKAKDSNQWHMLDDGHARKFAAMKCVFSFSSPRCEQGWC